jgi:hypothetical protein
MGKKTIFQVRTIPLEILFPSKGTPILDLQEHQQARNLLELLPGPQYRFLFGQNNVPLPRKTHNRRKNRNQRRVHNPPLALCLFPSSPNSHVMASTLMTRMMMQHPEPLPHTIIQPTTSVEIPPYNPPSLPLHHQALQRHWF